MVDCIFLAQKFCTAPRLEPRRDSLARIAVIGAGYVGLVTAACFADLGNQVTGIDIDQARVKKLQKGNAPIFEPQLEEMMARNAEAGRLRFTTDYEIGLDGAEFVFVAVGTPSGASGEADLSAPEAAARSIARAMKAPLIIVNKSTLPI